MDDISDDLGLPSRPEALGLDAGLINTNENIAGEGCLTVIKGNYISGPFVRHKLLVDPCHLRFIHQGNPKLKAFLVQEFADQRPGDALYKRYFDLTRGLPISHRNRIQFGP